MIPRRPLFLALACVALIALALGLAACGGDDDDSGAAAPATTAAGTRPLPRRRSRRSPRPPRPAAARRRATTLALQADPTGQLKFVESKLTAKAGEITIKLTNASAVPHDVAVERQRRASATRCRTAAAPS